MLCCSSFSTRCVYDVHVHMHVFTQSSYSDNSVE